MPTLKVKDADDEDVHLHAQQGDGSQGSPLVQSKWLLNLGELLANLSLDGTATAIARTQVVAALQMFNGATFDRVRGTTLNGLLVDVSRLPAAIQSALDTMVTRLTEIRDQQIVTSSITLAVPSADTALHAFASQAVKTPVTLSIRKGTSPVTINDGSGTDSVLEWDDVNGHHTFMKTFYVSNLSQLSYQFSAHNGTQVIEVQAGN